MAALLRHGAARRLGGSVVQRPVAEERRRLGPRFIHTKEVDLLINQAAGEDITSHIHRKKESDKSMCSKWCDRRLRFERFDAEFTKFLNGAFGLFAAYAILSSKDLLDKMEAAQTDNKK